MINLNSFNIKKVVLRGDRAPHNSGDPVPCTGVRMNGRSGMPAEPQAKNNQRYGKMARYFGYSPKSTVKSAVESFESKTQVRSAGGTLLGTVYVDIGDEEWAVAIAYGRAHHPKLRVRNRSTRSGTHTGRGRPERRRDSTPGRKVRAPLRRNRSRRWMSL